MSQSELQELLAEWRKEYDHPSLVAKTRKEDENIDLVNNYNNWDNYVQDKHFRKSWI